MGFQYPGPLCRHLSSHIPPNDPGTLMLGVTSLPGSTGLVHQERLKTHSPHCVHGNTVPDRDTLRHLKKLTDKQQALSQSHILVVNGKALKLEDREGVVAEVYFATDQSTIDPQDRAELLKVYNYYAKLLEGPSLRANPPKVRFKFVGYADVRGTETHNLKLSRKRAIAVAEYFSALRSSPHYNQGIVAMGESEHPQIVRPGASSVSAQLSRHRRVDVLARPVLTEVPNPPPVVVPPDPGSRSWAIRLVDSLGASVGVVGGSVARFEIVDIAHQQAMTLRYEAIGFTKGFSGRFAASMDSTGWEYFNTPQSLTFDDFEGHADHIGESVQIGYGYSVDRFIFLGPMKKGTHSVAIKFKSWGRGVSGGVSFEARGDVSKGIGPYPVSPDYLAAPPPGSRIRW